MYGRLSIALAVFLVQVEVVVSHYAVIYVSGFAATYVPVCASVHFERQSLLIDPSSGFEGG